MKRLFSWTLVFVLALTMLSVPAALATTAGKTEEQYLTKSQINRQNNVLLFRFACGGGQSCWNRQQGKSQNERQSP